MLQADVKLTFPDVSKSSAAGDTPDRYAKMPEITVSFMTLLLTYIQYVRVNMDTQTKLDQLFTNDNVTARMQPIKCQKHLAPNNYGSVK